MRMQSPLTSGHGYKGGHQGRVPPGTHTCGQMCMTNHNTVVGCHWGDYVCGGGTVCIPWYKIRVSAHDAVSSYSFGVMGPSGLMGLAVAYPWRNKPPFYQSTQHWITPTDTERGSGVTTATKARVLWQVWYGRVCRPYNTRITRCVVHGAELSAVATGGAKWFGTTT